MTPRFDRSKPYGEVIPAGHFWQDGHYFDNEGNYLRSDGELPKAKPPAPEAITEKPPAPEAAEIDLAAWAKGEKNYVFFSVVKAVKERFPEAKVGNKKADVLAVLVTEGVVTEAEAVR